MRWRRVRQKKEMRRESIRGSARASGELDSQHAGLVQQGEQREEHGHFDGEHRGLSDGLHIVISLREQDWLTPDS